MSVMDRKSDKHEQSALDRLLPQTPPEVRERLFGQVDAAKLPMLGEQGWHTMEYHGFPLAVWQDIVWVRRSLRPQEDPLDAAVHHRLYQQVERYARHRSGADRWPGGFERIDNAVQQLRTTGRLPRPLICLSSMGRFHVLDGMDELVGFEWHYNGLAPALRSAIDAWVGKHVEGSGQR